MMNAYTLPTSVNADGQVLHIRNNGDWRMAIDCNLALTDPELDEQERAIAALLIFYDEDPNTIKNTNAAVTAMLEFLTASTDDSNKTPNKPKLVDWEYDAPLIVSGINKVLGCEIRAIPYVHWWTFISYYMAIGEGTLSTVVGIRSKLLKNKKLDKHEEDFKRDNPQYFNVIGRREAKAGHDLMLELWGEE